MLEMQRLNHLSSQSKVALLLFQELTCLHCMHGTHWRQKVRGKADGCLSMCQRIDQALASPRPTQRVNESYFPSSLWDGSWLTSSSPHAPTPATAMYFWCAQHDELFQVSQNMGLPVLKIRAVPGKWR